MTQRKGDNKSVSERLREMLVGPGLVFLFVWIIMSMFRIGDPDAWEKIGHDLVVIFCIWVVWCFYLDLKERYSWGVEARKRRRRRKIERMKEEKQMILNGEDPHKTRKKITRIIKGSVSYIIALAIWVILSVNSIKMDKELYEYHNQPYKFSDACDVIFDNFIVVLGIWIVLIVALSWLKGPTRIHIDRD